MREVDPSSATLAGNLINRAREASAVALSGLAVVTPVVATEVFIGTPDSVAAGTPHAVADMSRPTQVQEYAEVVTKNSGGEVVAATNQNFTVTEICKDGIKKVHRTIKVKAGTQEPLGDCNEGKSVTAEEEQPASGDWLIKPRIKTILKATRHNNHFVFTDILENNTAPQPPSSTTTTTAGGGSSGSTGSGSSTGGGGSPGTGGGGGTGGGSGGGTGGGGGGETNPFAPGNIGADVGPYQCDGPNNTGTTIEGVMPTISFAMVDLEDGLGYSVNPCLSAEVSALTAAGVTIDYYINTGWYSGSSHLDTDTPKVCAPGDSVCDAYDYGSGNVSYIVQAIDSLGLTISGKRVFRDGETDNTWATDSNGQANSEQATENESSLQGTQDTLIDDGATDSLLYENPDFENTILDDLQTDEPIWLATGENSASAAASACDTIGPDGGTVELVQYNGAMTNGNPLDMDDACAIPAAPTSN